MRRKTKKKKKKGRRKRSKKTMKIREVKNMKPTMRTTTRGKEEKAWEEETRRH